MPEPAHPKNHYDSLKREVDGYIKYSHTWSIVWANVYYLLRVTLIVLAACVAAKDSLPRIAALPRYSPCLWQLARRSIRGLRLVMDIAGTIRSTISSLPFIRTWS